MIPELTRYAWLAIAILVFSGFLYWIGFFRAAKKVTYDCLMNETTQRFTINNLARFSILQAFLFVWISSHYNIQIKPAFQIQTIPFTEIELYGMLAFIIGAEAVKKINSKF